MPEFARRPVGLLLGGTRTDDVADHDESGRDPDAYLQRDLGGGFERRGF